MCCLEKPFIRSLQIKDFAIGNIFYCSHFQCRDFWLYLGEVNSQKQKIKVDYINGNISNRSFKSKSHILLKVRLQDFIKPTNRTFEQLYKKRTIHLAEDCQLKENVSLNDSALYVKEHKLKSKFNKDNIVGIKVPDNYLQLISDFHSKKADMLIKAFFTEENPPTTLTPFINFSSTHQNRLYIRREMAYDLSYSLNIANINGGTKSISPFLLLQ